MSDTVAFSAGIAALTAFVAAAVATPLVRAVARKAGAVAQPKSDRWHSRPTAMFGGVAIFAAVVAALLLRVPMATDAFVVLAASAALFVVGVVDDIVHIKPYQKLIGQLVGAAAVIYFGLVLPWTGSYLLNVLITLFWLIGVTNAVNMLDNMDGLASGIAAIAAAFLGFNFYANGQISEALMLTAFAGVLLGFLVYNHNPASIFMGDCGSMFIGFFLASSALLASNAGGGRSRSVVAVLAIPVLVLVVPIFDTTFVTVMRKMSGRAASQGGRDHTSHRLVALGLSERHAVWMLYSFALIAGVLSLLVRHASIDVSVAVITAFTIVMSLSGVYLGRVRVYDETELAAARQKPLVAFLVDLSYKRRVFEVTLDAVLIALAYYGAYALRFGSPVSRSSDWALFLKTLPAIVALKVLTFLACGVYRGVWRYTSISNLLDYVRAVALGSVASILVIVFAFRFDGFSRTVFIFDALLLFVAVAGSRFAFRALRRILPAPHSRSGSRVLIYGAGDGGELVYRELMNNAALNMAPVGFLDDDPMKSGRRIHGLQVYSPEVVLSDLCRKLAVTNVLISTDKISREKLSLIVGECAASGIVVSRVHMNFEPLAAADFGWVLATEMPPRLISRHGDVNLVHVTDHRTIGVGH